MAISVYGSFSVSLLIFLILVSITPAISKYGTITSRPVAKNHWSKISSTKISAEVTNEIEHRAKIFVTEQRFDKAVKYYEALVHIYRNGDSETIRKSIDSSINLIKCLMQVESWLRVIQVCDRVIMQSIRPREGATSAKMTEFLTKAVRFANKTKASALNELEYAQLSLIDYNISYDSVISMCTRLEADINCSLAQLWPQYTCHGNGKSLACNLNDVIDEIRNRRSDSSAGYDVSSAVVEQEFDDGTDIGGLKFMLTIAESIRFAITKYVTIWSYVKSQSTMGMLIITLVWAVAGYFY